jgi:hypothetical protein
MQGPPRREGDGQRQADSRVVLQSPRQALVNRGVLGVQPPHGIEFPGGGLQASRGLFRHFQGIPAERSSAARLGHDRPQGCPAGYSQRGQVP